MVNEKASEPGAESVTDPREQFKDKEITIHFGKGLAHPLPTKLGRELVQILIPNRDINDKTPWAYFLLPAKKVHENQFGKGLWAKLPANGTTVVSKPVQKGKEGGKVTWGRDQVRISNEELKAVVEACRTKERRPSVLDQLGKAKDEGKQAAERPPGKKQPAKTEPAL